MKKVQNLFLMLIFSSITLTVHAQEEASWKAMEDFHAVMSTTFHPADEGNLQPLKDKAGDLLNKATAWQKSTVPGGYNGALTRPILKRLVKQCRKINEAVKSNTSDAELKIMITDAHEIFHEIKEKCLKPDH